MESESIIGKFFIQVIDDLLYTYERVVKHKTEEDTLRDNEALAKRVPFSVEWKNYWIKASRRDILKDILFFSSVIGFFYCIYFVHENVDKLVVPSMTKRDGMSTVTFEGNCDWLREEYKYYHQTATNNYDYKGKFVTPDNFPSLKLIITNDSNGTLFNELRWNKPSGIINVEECNNSFFNESLCPQTICEKEVCPSCPEVVCPSLTCPTCNGLDNVTIKKLLNLRPGANGVWAYSGGYSRCLKDVWELLKVDGRPKYSIAPSQNTKFVMGEDLGDSMVCFHDASNQKDKTSFYLNTSIWWTKDKGSYVTFYKHKYPRLNETSVFANNDVVCWDSENNETIAC